MVSKTTLLLLMGAQGAHQKMDRHNEAEVGEVGGTHRSWNLVDLSRALNGALRSHSALSRFTC